MWEEGGHNVGKNGEKWIFSPKVILSFLEKQIKKAKHSFFFRLQRLEFVQKIRKFQCAVFEKKRTTPVLGISFSKCRKREVMKWVKW